VELPLNLAELNSEAGVHHTAFRRVHLHPPPKRRVHALDTTNNVNMPSHFSVFPISSVTSTATREFSRAPCRHRTARHTVRVSELFSNVLHVAPSESMH